MKKFLLAAATLACLTSTSAWAGYTIQRQDGGSNTLVQGREYGFIVKSSPALFENILIENDGSPLADYQITVGIGVQKGPNAFKPDSSGQLAFIIRFNKAPGNVTLTIRNSADSNVFTTANFTLQRYPVSFRITPPSPTVDANVPFNIDLIAVDAGGTWVSAFEDAVQITDQQLGEITPVSGAAFVGGVATVPVNIKAGDMNNQTRLTLTLAGPQYVDPSLPAPSLVPPATFTSSIINVRPGAFNKVVMLFPGEVLKPGIGKDSTNISTQTAGRNVDEVDIWRVDSFFNPILASVPTTISFTSSNGSDTPPADQTMTVPPLKILGTSASPFVFPSNGNRTIKATPDGNDAQADTSNVPVNPGAVFSYVFTVQPPVGPITVDDTIQVEITAFDGIGKVLTTLNGQLTGAKLSVLAGGEDRTDWVDTDPATDVPDNVVNFVKGVATVRLIVTKRATGVQLRFKDQFSVRVDSNKFDVNRGVPKRILFTVVGKEGAVPLVGQIYTPGTYPGNSGTAPVVKVGEKLIVEARITDNRWNLYADFSINGTPLQVTGELPNNFLVATHPLDPSPTFDSSGEMSYVPGFDNSFRVSFRTAGVAQRIRGVTTIGATQFFSSTVTVLPEVYSKLVVQAPGETLRPGTLTEADGKTGAPTAQQAGVPFTVTAFATDLYFNPVGAGPYPSLNYGITPVSSNSFMSGSFPSQMLGSSKNFIVQLQQGSVITMTDAGDSTKTQAVSIPGAFGPLDHFTMTAPAGDQTAGTPFNVTIEARDQFNNLVANYNQPVRLSATTGANTMNPPLVNLVNGSFSGTLTLFTASDSVNVSMVNGGINSISSPMRVVTASSGYKRVLLLLPGETPAPGVIGLAGKSGTPTPVTAGVVSLIRAIACDDFYNPVNATGLVQFSSNHYAQFAPVQGSYSNVDGHGELDATMVLRTAAIHNIMAIDVNGETSGTILHSSSTITVNAGSYKKLQLLLPGEVSDPGTNVPTGKTSAAPLPQKAGVPFTVSIKAVDDFWNVVAFNAGDIRLDANTPAVLYQPPNNADTLTDTPRLFTAGSATRDVIIGTATLVQLTASDDANLTKAGQTVELNMQPGPLYTVSAPTSTIAGQPFSITVTLQEGGVPLAGYNESIFVTAASPLGGAATGNFKPDGSAVVANMKDGVVTVTGLTYAYAETIQVKISDNFSRVAFSGNVEVQPSGLKYQVTVPTEAVAGPPSNFPVTIELLDQNTNTRVKNHDHQVQISVVSAVSGTTDGQFGPVSTTLSQGFVTVPVSYTKAESVVVKISESLTGGDPTYVIPEKSSNNMLVKADGYKKLLLLAPGETHVPGVPSATGKSGAPTSRQIGVPFLMQVRGVDQYWNVANDFSGGQIQFQSNDTPASITATNPVNQNAPLVSGESASSISMFKRGDWNVTVKDSSNINIAPQTVLLNVGGNSYAITLPTQEFTLNPFLMNVTLLDQKGNPILTANNGITIEAVDANGVVTKGNVGVTHVNLKNGTIDIPNQTYNLAEIVYFRITDDNGIRTTSSSSVRFIPAQISYRFTVPESAEVNSPFNITIQAIDQATGQNVSVLNRTNLLSAVTISGLPVTGTFSVSTINFVNGSVTVPATYNLAESIVLSMHDGTSRTAEMPPVAPDFTSGQAIRILPGAMVSIGLADFSIRSNEIQTYTLTAKDTFGNIIPNQRIHFNVGSTGLPGTVKLNGQTGELIAQTDPLGQIALTVEPTITANGVYDLVITEERPNANKLSVKIKVLGFPEVPAKAAELGGNRIPVNSTFKIDLGDINTNGGTLRTFYRIDGHDWIAYDPAVGIKAAAPDALGYPVFSEPRAYKLEWYSQICYDVACSTPVSELSIKGGPNQASILAFDVAGKLVGYPSPFNPKSTSGVNYLTLQYPLSRPSDVQIDIYDLFGQKVWHRDIAAGTAGKAEASDHNQEIWMGTNDNGMTVGNGGYIVVVKADGTTMKSKILVVK